MQRALAAGPVLAEASSDNGNENFQGRVDFVDNAVDSLSSLMEPMIMAILGVLVGGLMIAMYLPIFMLGSVI